MFGLIWDFGGSIGQLLKKRKTSVVAAAPAAAPAARGLAAQRGRHRLTPVFFNLGGGLPSVSAAFDFVLERKISEAGSLQRGGVTVKVDGFKQRRQKTTEGA